MFTDREVLEQPDIVELAPPSREYAHHMVGLSTENDREMRDML
jgi:hypothetical protein